MLIRTIVAIFTIIIFASCQKEFLNENPSAPVNPADSTYIDKVYAVDINATSIDTTDIWTYNYDNSKRVVSLIIKATDPNDMSGSKRSYFYNNADTLPFKTIVYETYFYIGQYNTDTLTKYHSFDNSGKNLKDSVIYKGSSILSGPNFTYVTIYSYAINKIFGIRRNTSSPDETDTATVDGNGNILTYTAYRYNALANSWDLLRNAIFSYDTKRSPFLRLSNFKTYGVFPNGETYYSELPSYNCRLSQIENHFPGTQSFSFNFSNIYKTNQQLKEILIYEQPPTPSFYSKLLFTYKAL